MITVEFKKRFTKEEKVSWAERGGEAEILYSEAPGIINWALELSPKEVTAVFKEMPERIRRSNLEAARFNNPLVDWMLGALIPCPDGATQIGSKGEYRWEGTQHIPDRSAQMVRYLGWYSNRMRGDRRKAEDVGANCEEKKADQSEVIVVSGFNPKKVPLLVWRECIKNEESRSSLTWGG